MNIEAAITKGPIANFAAVGMKIAQGRTAFGARLVSLLCAGISKGIAGVLHQHDFTSGIFHNL